MYSTLTKSLFLIKSLYLSMVISLACSNTYAVECQVDTSRSNLVKFTSDAPIEDFEGVSDRIDGYVFWQGEELRERTDFDKSELYFEVELGALDTGIGLRNRHMRENYLETDKYPFATFSGKISQVTETSPGEFLVTSTGSFIIHGSTKEQIIECRVQKEDSGYRIQSDFQVQLPDYNIEVPSLMFMKINEVIEVSLDFYVSVIDTGENK